MCDMHPKPSMLVMKTMQSQFDLSSNVIPAMHTCMNNQLTTSPLKKKKKKSLDVIQSHPLHRTRLANTRPHRLHWGDREMDACILVYGHSSNACVHGTPYLEFKEVW